MKKLFSIVCLAAIVFCLAGCVKNESMKTVTEETFPEGAVVVSTADELISAFANLMTDDQIILETDIDMSGKSLSVVNTRSFSLDGNGHTISNYHVNDASGLFVDYCGDRKYTIRNLTIENCSVNSIDDHAALFIGGARDTDAVTIENCHAVNCQVTGAKYAAVFISYTAGVNKGNGQSVPMQIIDCSATGCEITGGGSTGIAIGHSGGNEITENLIYNLSVNNCIITGPSALYEGVVIGTAGSGSTKIENVAIHDTVLACNTGEDKRSYYGRNLSELIIDGVLQEKTVT